MKKGRLMTCPGHVTLQVHEPIAAPRIESPTADDARDLAMRIERIVRARRERDLDAQMGADQIVGQLGDRAAGDAAPFFENAETRWRRGARTAASARPAAP